MRATTADRRNSTPDRMQLSKHARAKHAVAKTSRVCLHTLSRVCRRESGSKARGFPRERWPLRHRGCELLYHQITCKLPPPPASHARRADPAMNEWLANGRLRHLYAFFSSTTELLVQDGHAGIGVRPHN